MTDKNLYYFKTVADCGSISEAAEKLYIAQPSLTQTIKRIEAEAGTTLFQRMNSGLVLTTAGKEYYQMASQILNLYVNFQTTVVQMDKLEHGSLSVGASGRLGRSFFAKVLSDFHTLYPKVKLEIIEENTNKLETLLELGKLDIAILHTIQSDNNPALNYDNIISTPFVIVASESDPIRQLAREEPGYEFPVIDLALLGQQNFILSKPTQRSAQVANKALKKAGIIHPNVLLYSRNGGMIQDLCANGMGICILPRDYIDETNEKAAFYNIPSYYEASWTLSIVTAKNTVLQKAGIIFTQMVKEYLT